MKPSQPWKWLLLGLIVLLLASTALLPRLIGDSSSVSRRATAALAEWSGGQVRLIGPVRVRYFPSVVVRCGLELRNASRLPLVQSVSTDRAKISLNLADLLFGRINVDALNLGAPEITLKKVPGPGARPEQAPQALIANLLAGTPVSVLSLRHATIHFPTQAGGEVLRDFEGRFDASGGNGALSGLGSFAFRNQAVEFMIDSGKPAESDQGQSIPATIKLTSTPVAASLTGTAKFGDTFSFDGDMQADIGNARQFLNWLGVAVPDGESLRGLSASGSVHWAGSTLTFDDGSFTLDGNSADGLLAVTVGPRPRLEGTLDFDKLSLDPYVVSAKDDATPSGPPFDWALLKYLDADLRISADDVGLSTLKLGRGGFTITSKQGVMTGEIGELELCGGSVSGRIGLDISQKKTKASVIGSVNDVSVDDCLGALALGIPVKGTGGFSTEVSTEGANWDELLRGLSGSLKVNARNGAVPVDFRRLSGTTPLEGWSPNSLTLFNTLKADCRLSAGHIWCQMFNMQTRREVISGSGDVDMGRRTLDLSLLVASPVSPVVTAQREPSQRLSISGALSQPVIRRADSPTFGEGTTGSGPSTIPISPR
jgi:AsmA protein